MMENYLTSEQVCFHSWRSAQPVSSPREPVLHYRFYYSPEGSTIKEATPDYSPCSRSCFKFW